MLINVKSRTTPISVCKIKALKGKILKDKIEDREEYFVITTIINQKKINIKPKIIFIAKMKPIYVATPFPPLNLSQTGNKCPKMIKLDKKYINISV